ncbi:hypothetical protein MP638_002872, partial (mitochondrion) [Amoeboaphelidium occidentale]
ERKVQATIQHRVGPNIVGPYVDSPLGILILLAIGGLELYGILLGGYASQNS